MQVSVPTRAHGCKQLITKLAVTLGAAGSGHWLHDWSSAPVRPGKKNHHVIHVRVRHPSHCRSKISISAPLT